MRIRKKVYTSSMQMARESGKLDEYNESFRLNVTCANAIYKTINDSNYEPNLYSLTPIFVKRYHIAVGLVVAFIALCLCLRYF